MKNVFLFLVFSLATAAFAQNYDCLHAGEKRFFTNANGYLRCIKVDSVRTEGDTTAYYLFHTPRGAYDVNRIVDAGTLQTLDTNGGSWEGKRVARFNNGDFVFDSYWGGEGVTIRTQSSVGDSWTFYHDSSRLWYQATVLSADTITFLSILDSVKTFVVNAYNDSGLVISDPANGFKFKLSKLNGFIQTFDFYTFPYHKTDSVFRPGLDFFMDRIANGCSFSQYLIANAPSYVTSIFNIVDFNIPNDLQLFALDSGDFLESRNINSLSNSYVIDSFFRKSANPHAVTYVKVTTRWRQRPSSRFYYDSTVQTLHFTVTDTNYTICPSTFVPETIHSNIDLYYFPNDSGLCTISPKYTTCPTFYLVGLGCHTEYTTYKFGLSTTANFYDDFNGVLRDNQLISCRYRGVQCNDLFLPPDLVASIPYSSPQHDYIYPNPASTNIYIKFPTTVKTATFYNLLGGQVRSIVDKNGIVFINVSDFTPGQYVVYVNEGSFLTFIKE